LIEILGGRIRAKWAFESCVASFSVIARCSPELVFHLLKLFPAEPRRLTRVQNGRRRCAISKTSCFVEIPGLPFPGWMTAIPPEGSHAQTARRSGRMFAIDGRNSWLIPQQHFCAP
jgi:hypothetical protein